MTKTPPRPARKPWLRPAAEKIAAGQAEAFTRVVSDGGIPTS